MMTPPIWKLNFTNALPGQAQSSRLNGGALDSPETRGRTLLRLVQALAHIPILDFLAEAELAVLWGHVAILGEVERWRMLEIAALVGHISSMLGFDLATCGGDYGDGS